MISPYFGRAWKITVDTQAGETVTLSDSSWEPESLRVTFAIEQIAMRAFWTADVSVFNLNASTEQYVLRQGDWVNIMAGYQGTFGATLPASQSSIRDPLGNTLPSAPAMQSSSLLFRGRMFQPIWDRRDVTDFVVTLRCMLGLFEDTQNFVSFTQSAGASQSEVVTRMAREARAPLALENVGEGLAQKRLPRGKVVFGSPGEYSRQIAADNGMASWISPHGLNIRTLEPSSDTAEPDLIFGPPQPNEVTVHPTDAARYTPTLIGTPQQTQEGVVFRTLLDSRIKIGSLVKLDLSVIRQMPRTIGSYPGMLDQDGMYVVAGMRQLGDTRGNEWYTEVIGLTRQFWPLLYGGQK